MLKKIFNLFYIIFIILSISTCTKRNIQGNNISSENQKVTILYSNNSNNYLEDCNCPSSPWGGIVRRGTIINKFRKKNANLLLFDTGDMFSAYSKPIKSKYMVKCYEYLKYDELPTYKNS